MPQVINTNIASLNAQRNLNASQSQANVALERLSSGLRINSAKDDAAGLAISERFQSQIAGLNQAQRNANDGISLAQTAEGAMDEITNNLQRIRELAVQSANATNSISDRQALNQEVQQRIEEINRIAAQTSFNGLKVLDGTFETQTFQVGANTGETIAISGLDSRGSQIGSVLKETVGFSEFEVAQGDPGETLVNVSDIDLNAGLTVNITLGGQSVTVDTSSVSDPGSLATAINSGIANTTTLTGVTAELSTDGNSIVFANTGDTPVTADISISDDTGTQVSVTGLDVDPLNAAAFAPQDTELYAGANTLDLDTDVSGSFGYDDGNGGTGTVNFSLTGNVANDLSTLAGEINSSLQGEGLDGDLEAVVNGTAIDIRNKTDDTAYTLTSVSVSDNVTPTANTINTGTVNATAGTTTSTTQAITTDISSLNFDSGVTGSLSIDGTPVNFELSAGTSLGIGNLASSISNALTNEGFTNLSVTANGNVLEINNSDTGNSYSVTGFNAADGGEPNNSVSSTSPIPAVESITLVDRFNEGEAYNFNVDINGEIYSFENVTSINDIVSQVNAKSNDTGIQANLNADNDEIFFSSQFGEPFNINIQADLDRDGAFDPATETIQSVVSTVENDTVSMIDIDISTREGADLAMIAVDYAIDSINGFRAELGAVQNRFESTIANLATTSENLSASLSRIRDADFAAESAELARTQVLQQAGLSVLAQANARPQQVLQLLQG
ncbi:hypothetical protein ACP86_02065 [Marinobacter sp. CP1]|jgi:flagellin|uniref:flagellin N-terminal helical domain-containing protein n=1 Tax=unclassified Marinobacter TaxID=83889 RepID=UPI00069FAE53|nr:MULTISPECIES: flagellin [unclassified Marinobacter]AKV95044.1 hypothetical protein ACP86_02065 [Marinobacter sp. CP1]